MANDRRGRVKRVVLVWVGAPPGRSSQVDASSWLYLARDYTRLRRWEANHPGRVDTAAVLDSAAASLRQPFNDWVDDLSRLNGSRTGWWLTPLSERNTMVDPLFLHVCYLEVARRQLTLEHPPSLIVCDSRGLLIAIAQLATSLGFEVSVRDRMWLVMERLPAALNWLLLALFYWVHFAQRRFVCLTTRRGSLAARLRTPSRKLIYVTFFDDGNLSADGIFHDRYVPGLTEWLETKDWEVWVLPMIGYRTWSPKQYRWARRSQSHVILPEDWLRLSDYVSVFLVSIGTVRFPAKVPLMAGMDVSAVMSEARRRQATVNSTRLAGLLERVPGRLARAGFTPERILTWSENQVYDKAVLKGSRRAFPHARLTAVQNAPLYPNCLSHMRTPAECDAGVSGDRVVCSGPLPAQLLADASKGKLATVVGCGPRYAYLHTRPPRAAPNTQERIEALVALPVSLSQAVATMDLILGSRHNVLWLVKCHPDYRQSALTAALGKPLPSGMQLVDGHISEWMGRVDLVVTTASGIALEAAAAGVPVIVVGSPNELTFNPLEWFKHDEWRPCFTSRQLDDRIAGLAAGQSANPSLATEVRDSWFTPVTPAALEEFIA
jgi:hypothetical protein